MMSVSDNNVEDFSNILEGNTTAILPVGVDLCDGGFTVVAFQPKCKLSGNCTYL